MPIASTVETKLLLCGYVVKVTILVGFEISFTAHNLLRYSAVLEVKTVQLVTEKIQRRIYRPCIDR